MLKKLIIGLCVIYWPLNLYFANTNADFFKNAIPGSILLYYIYSKNRFIPTLSLLAIPFINTKLSILPVLIIGIQMFTTKKIKINLVLFCIAAAIFLFNFKSFWGQTVFIPDYQKQQEVLQKITLYPNIPMARIYQNKAKIIADKISFNFFSLTDPNNYLFGFHPRQIAVDNQNLQKLPSFSFIFLLYALFFTPQFYKKNYLSLAVFISCLLNLSILSLFDRNDFILWAPLTAILITGVNEFTNKLAFWKKIFLFLFFIFTIVSYIRLFIISST